MDPLQTRREDDAFTVAWGFSEAGVAVDDRVQDQILEVRAHLFHNLVRQAQPRVVHRQQDPSTAKDGLSWVCTIFTVLSNLPSPSKAKYSHWTAPSRCLQP